MKIHDSYSSSDPTAAHSGQAQRAQEAASLQGAAAAKARQKTATENPDEVNLSGLASVLQDAITETPEKAARLEKLAELFAAGKYQVDARTVAGAVIDETLKGAGQREPHK